MIFAVRLVFPGFWTNVAVKFPVPAPDGVTEHHAASLEAVQAFEEVTAKTVVPGYDQTA